MTSGEKIDQEWMDILGGAEEEASAARERMQYGVLDIQPRYVRWVTEDDKRLPKEITPTEYKDTPTRTRSLEVVFSVNIQEFNPSLDWTYERRVNVGGADWHRILKPSIEELMGEGTMEKETMGATLGQLRGKYVAVADVLQSPTKRNPDPEYRTAKFVTIFADRDACYAEWYERYGESVEAAAESESLDAPDTFAAEWEGFDLESEASQAKALCDEYGDLADVASEYYGVSLESVVNAYAQGGLSDAKIAKLSKDLTPAKVKKIHA